VLRRATELVVVDTGHRNSLPGWPPAHAHRHPRPPRRPSRSRDYNPQAA
jgi:hypothetical protein